MTALCRVDYIRRMTTMERFLQLEALCERTSALPPGDAPGVAFDALGDGFVAVVPHPGWDPDFLVPDAIFERAASGAHARGEVLEAVRRGIRDEAREWLGLAR